MFGYIIDFKSRFTATHTSGVSAVSAALAQMFEFQDEELKMITIAANLHDIGKLAVPTEILEKPDSLDYFEFSSIRGHTFYTYNILKPLKGLELINQWASFHHESLDGKGYPFHVKGDNIPLGSRIVTVADIFTALAEERPYRKGMTKEAVDKVFVDFVLAGHVDHHVYEMLKENYDAIDEIRKKAQSDAMAKYTEFREQIKS